MNKLQILIVAVFFISMHGTQANEVIVLADFEDGTLQGTNAWEGNIIEIEDNPFPDEVNSSSKVLAFAGLGPWQAINRWNGDGEIFDPEYSRFVVDVWVPENQLNQDDRLAFQLIALGSIGENPNYTQLVYVTEPNQWVTLEFDLSGMQFFDYRQLALQCEGVNFYSDNYKFVIEINPMFADFEDGELQGFNEETGSVVDNPGPDGINNSEKVLFFEGNAFSGPNRWDGEGNQYKPAYIKLRVDVYVTLLGVNDPWDESITGDLVAFRPWGMNSLSDAPNWISETKYVYETNKWHTLEFDLSSMEHFDYRNFFFQSHITNFYVDNFQWITDILYNVNLLSNPQEGGTLTGMGDYEPGEEVTITATPNTGYNFINWTDQEDNIISDQPEFSFDMPEENILYTANFELQQFSLSLSPQPTEGGTISADPPGEFYTYQQQITLTSTPAEGYRFQNWRLDGVTLSTDSEFVYTMPAENVNITAHFILEDIPVYNLTLLVNPENAGTATGSGDFEEGETVTVNASPAEGYRFINWTDESENEVSTSEIYQFTIPAKDLTLTANFEESTNIEQTTLKSVKVYPVPAKEFLTISADKTINQVDILNMNGQIVFSDVNLKPNSNIPLKNIKNGTYLVNIFIENQVVTKKIQIITD